MNGRSLWRTFAPLLLCAAPVGAAEWNLHGQFTGVTQYHPSFEAPVQHPGYRGFSER
jgi:hypothetical protein